MVVTVVCVHHGLRFAQCDHNATDLGATDLRMDLSPGSAGRPLFRVGPTNLWTIRPSQHLDECAECARRFLVLDADCASGSYAVL